MKRAAGLGLIVGFVSLNVAGLAGSVGAVTLGPEITVEADDGETFPQSYDVADRLKPGAVLRATRPALSRSRVAWPSSPRRVHTAAETGSRSSSGTTVRRSSNIS